MAAQSEIPPAVADTDDNISSPAVAAASSASGSCNWGKLESSRCDDLVSLDSGTTTISQYQRTTQPNNMDAHSLASPLPGGTSEPKETTAEPIAAESELSASVGKAAGASSAVAEMAPPAVEESANQGILPEQRGPQDQHQDLPRRHLPQSLQTNSGGVTYRSKTRGPPLRR